MKINLTAPCSNCPFRSDIEPYITLDRFREITEALMVNDESFVCHKTTKRSPTTYSKNLPSGAQHCGGALVFLWKQRHLNRAGRMAVAFGLLKLEDIDTSAPVYGSLAEIEDRFKSKKQYSPLDIGYS